MTSPVEDWQRLPPSNMIPCSPRHKGNLQGRRASMRGHVGLLAGAVLAVFSATPVQGREPSARYHVAPDLKTYPQGTAKEAFASVLEAIKKKRIDYLLAQLAEPDWVDGRVDAYQ